jgi:hypothetical protein
VGILVGGALLVTAIGYLHALTGLAYEFLALFIVPVLAVSWFLEPCFGYALAVLAAVQWFLADRTLAGYQAALLPLHFLQKNDVGIECAQAFTEFMHHHAAVELGKTFMNIPGGDGQHVLVGVMTHFHDDYDAPN